MKVDIPAFEQFSMLSVDEIRFSGVNQELNFSVGLEPRSITNRVAVALMDQRNHRGMAVAVYPATGEVCDITNGGGVIGYLSRAPYSPDTVFEFELSVFRFGKNFVCSVKINGEVFLYPAFISDAAMPMAAMVGKESHNGDRNFAWNNLSIELHELDGVIAA